MKGSSSDTRAYQVVDRLLGLRNLLRAKPHTWAQIVSRLHDDYKDNDSGKRKLRRDLQYLKRWGYDLERDPATKTYALTAPQIEHDWTEKELLALAALRESFASGMPYAETIQGLLRKIEQGFDEDQRALYKRKPALTIKFTAAEDTAPTTGVRQKLESAIQRHQRIRFRYKPSDRPRIIDHPDDEPIELFFDEGHYYMRTYCYKMSRMYKFRVSMIVPDSIEILPKRAEGRWRPQMVHFKYWLSPKITERSVSPRFPDMDIDLEKSGKGGVIVTATAYSEFEAIREILRYGEQAEILSPDSLRAKMRRVVEQMASLYSRTVE